MQGVANDAELQAQRPAQVLTHILILALAGCHICIGKSFEDWSQVPQKKIYVMQRQQSIPADTHTHTHTHTHTSLSIVSNDMQ